MDNLDKDFINKQMADSPRGGNMGFLPTAYEIPETPSNYMKLIDGRNKFRVLSSAIVGYEWWVESQDGKRSPKRARTFNEAMEQGIDPIKPFWAFAVWDYQSKAVKILELTQKTIMHAIKSLTEDEDWGMPQNYDITVSRSGEKLETKYAVMPSPAKELDKDIAVIYAGTKIVLERLYDGLDPFKAE